MLLKHTIFMSIFCLNFPPLAYLQAVEEPILVKAKCQIENPIVIVIVKIQVK